MPYNPGTVLFPWERDDLRRRGYFEQNGVWYSREEQAARVQASRDRLAEMSNRRNEPIGVFDSLRLGLNNAASAGRNIFYGILNRWGPDAARQGPQYEQSPIVSFGIDAIQDSMFRNHPVAGVLTRAGVAGGVATAVTGNPIIGAAAAATEGVRGVINAFAKSRKKRDTTYDVAGEVLAEEIAENEQLKKQIELQNNQASPVERFNNLQMQNVVQLSIPAQRSVKPKPAARRRKLYDPIKGEYFNQVIAGVY